MSNKIDFAQTLNELDDGIAKTGNQCFNYGITWGCDIDCPVFQRGECELQKENEIRFEEEKSNRVSSCTKDNSFSS